MPSPSRPQPSRDDNRRAALAMFGAAAGFALMAALAHGLRGDLPWPVVAFARCAAMLAVMAGVLAARRAPLVLLGNRTLWLRSVFGTLGLLTTFYCLSRMPVADTVVIFAMSPLWIVLITARLDRAPTPPATWLHLALALSGVLLMERPSFSADSLPLAVALAGSVAVAVAMVSLSRTHDYPQETVVTHFSLFATLATLALALSGAGGTLPAGAWSPARHLPVLAAMGVCGTAGQLLMTAAYRRGRPSLMALVGLSQIVMGAGLDAAVFGHGVDAPKAAGMALIVLGITLNARRGAVEAG